MHDIWSPNATSNGLVFLVTFSNASGQSSMASTSARWFFFKSTRLYQDAKSLSKMHAKVLVSRKAIT